MSVPRRVLCVVVHRTWDPTGWRQDSGDNGRSTFPGREQAGSCPCVSGGKKLRLLSAEMLDFLDKKAP